MTQINLDAIENGSTIVGQVFDNAIIQDKHDLTFEDCVFRSAGFEWGKYSIFKACQNIRLNRPQVFGPKSVTTKVYGLMARDCDGFEVDTGIFRDVSHGLLSTSTDNLKVHHSDFGFIRTDGLQVQNGSDIWIEGNYFHDLSLPGNTGHPDAMQIYNYADAGGPVMTNITIRGNRAVRRGGGMFQGIFIRSYSGKPGIENILIEDNEILGSMYHGIWSAYPATIRNNTVIGYPEPPDINAWINCNNPIELIGNAATWYVVDGVNRKVPPEGNASLPKMTEEQALAYLASANVPPPDIEEPPIEPPSEELETVEVAIKPNQRLVVTVDTTTTG